MALAYAPRMTYVPGPLGSDAKVAALEKILVRNAPGRDGVLYVANAEEILAALKDVPLYAIRYAADPPARLEIITEPAWRKYADYHAKHPDEAPPTVIGPMAGSALVKRFVDEGAILILGPSLPGDPYEFRMESFYVRYPIAGVRNTDVIERVCPEMGENAGVYGVLAGAEAYLNEISKSARGVVESICEPPVCSPGQSLTVQTDGGVTCGPPEPAPGGSSAPVVAAVVLGVVIVGGIALAARG